MADMLREMSRLEEDDTWETRMAIEKMLVARNEQLREKAKKKE